MPGACDLQVDQCGAIDREAVHTRGFLSLGADPVLPGAASRNDSRYGPAHPHGRGRLFATEVLSDGADYRYAERENKQRTMRAVELEPGLQIRCLNLAKELGLSLSGIDLRRTPDGAYYCFEVNTSPGFTFFENYTGQRIGDALADLLCAGRA